MYRKLGLILFVLTLSLMLAVPALADSPIHRNADVQIYVTGQDLVYDSVVISNNLPPHGPFQKLEFAGPTGLQTEFGPGDQEYVGGRWWIDTNGNDRVDSDDILFSCPLLGPGYEPGE